MEEPYAGNPLVRVCGGVRGDNEPPYPEIKKTTYQFKKQSWIKKAVLSTGKQKKFSFKFGYTTLNC